MVVFLNSLFAFICQRRLNVFGKNQRQHPLSRQFTLLTTSNFSFVLSYIGLILARIVIIRLITNLVFEISKSTRVHYCTVYLVFRAFDSTNTLASFIVVIVMKQKENVLVFGLSTGNAPVFWQPSCFISFEQLTAGHIPLLEYQIFHILFEFFSLFQKVEVCSFYSY